MNALYTMNINQRLISANLKKNGYKQPFNIHNALFNDRLKDETKKFLMALTGNEAFYQELYNTYKPINIEKCAIHSNVFLNIKKIISNSSNCYDILTDYTSYRNYI